MNTLTERITATTPISEFIGNARVEYDLSLDIACMLSSNPDVERMEAPERGELHYFLKEGGVMEMKYEVTSIGKVVFYFKNCPKTFYDMIEARIAKRVEETNQMYPVRN